ncbi:MAG: cobalamin-dependent protein [Desulfobacterales bacterium]|nr:cobalamin-dependent protein [Desulfobacterales bacterium]
MSQFENETIQKIYDGMVAIENDAVLSAVDTALSDGLNVLDVIDVLRQGLKVVGDDFDKMIRFLPELILAADLMQEAMKKIEPELEKQDITEGPSATIVLANIQGDIHDIGRNILGAVLKAAGFTVYDLGHDMKATAIIDKAIAYDADLIGLSSLLTTSLPFAEEVIKQLGDRDLRDKFKVVMGGGAVTPEYCEEVGADAYGKDAGSAVNVLQGLL